jgi:hypothetical protein
MLNDDPFAPRDETAATETRPDRQPAADDSPGARAVEVGVARGVQAGIDPATKQYVRSCRPRSPRRERQPAGLRAGGAPHPLAPRGGAGWRSRRGTRQVARGDAARAARAQLSTGASIGPARTCWRWRRCWRSSWSSRRSGVVLVLEWHHAAERGQINEAANRGQSFVMQGPPGTGKSQTIANVIAETIGRGKRVLFVSEKAAALDVVHKRLAASGLDEYCLTLHGEHAGGREVVQALDRSLTSSLRARLGMRSDELHRLANLRSFLNDTAALPHASEAALGGRTLRATRTSGAAVLMPRRCPEPRTVRSHWGEYPQAARRTCHSRRGAASSSRPKRSRSTAPPPYRRYRASVQAGVTLVPAAPASTCGAAARWVGGASSWPAAATGGGGRAALDPRAAPGAASPIRRSRAAGGTPHTCRRKYTGRARRPVG